MVDSESGDRYGSFHSPAGAHRDVDRRARLDGYSVHSEFKAVRTDPLPLHGTLLSRDDRTGARACFGGSFPLTFMDGFYWRFSFLAEARSFGGPQKGRGENSPS